MSDRRSTLRTRISRAGARCVLALGGLALVPALGEAQQFVEYPGHPATYGDHQITTTWTGGPTLLTLTFESDENILHEDGLGQSQRTARNTLTFAPPSDPANPQDYDDLAMIDVYGMRLPLLQQMSADGTSTLRFDFAQAVEVGFDLFITDVDTADDVRLRAFGPGASPIDMTTWAVSADGDLSLYKNTGTGYSEITAPSPLITATSAELQLLAADATNYNRSYTVLRAPVETPVAAIEVEFTGIQNSPNRAQGGNGAHIYVGLSTRPPTADVAHPGQPGGLTVLSTLPLRSGADLRLAIALAEAGPSRLRLIDPAGRTVVEGGSFELGAGRHESTISTRGIPHPGVYFIVLETRDGRAARKLVIR
ncbi:MAG: T9SS type A sorting domain-containing protein [Candidatus Eisenbacteria bacterium]|nr:T9SS type A sorting domain-containing protein [Candidatus Eisenbacteria bacterium]